MNEVVLLIGDKVVFRCAPLAARVTLPLALNMALDVRSMLRDANVDAVIEVRWTDEPVVEK